MGNVLEFTLGLEASKFLDQIGVAGKAITVGLGVAGKAVGEIFEKAWGQIEKGAALNDLSKRTGETVANLFQLQKGFTAAGLSASDVAPALFMMNKALGGVNEAGESTADVFTRAGLSVEALKKAGGGGAMSAILGKMAGMDQTSATKFASSVFGRGEAANMVQLSRSMGEFTEGMKGAAAQAMVFQRVAALFDTIEKAVGKVKAKLDPIFLVIAEHIAPALEAVLGYLNAIDLTPLVDGIGAAFDVFAEAFKEGRIMELLSKGFFAAVEYLGNMIVSLLGDSGFWGGIWDVMIGALEMRMVNLAREFLNVAMIFEAALIAAVDKAMELVGKIPGVGGFTGLSGYEAKTFGEHYKDQRDKYSGVNSMLDGAFAGGKQRSGSGLSSVGDALSRANANAGGTAQDEFSDLVGELLGKRPKRRATGSGGGGGASAAAMESAGRGPAATAIEKMGFVFGGGMVNDHAATTAKNTGKIAQIGEQILAAVSPKAGGMPANCNSHA